MRRDAKRRHSSMAVTSGIAGYLHSVLLLSNIQAKDYQDLIAI
jgi:hypothetical protein